MAFDHLGEHLSQDELLGEVLGPNHNPIGAPFTTADRQEEQQKEKKDWR
jgi:hypothetical protein